MRTITLRDALIPRNEIVHPRDNPSGEATFVGLEHIEPNTGRRIGSLPIRLEQMTGRKARFYEGDIVYGYLRPYLNKVWVAEFDGYCSVDQYVFAPQDIADPHFVASFMRSPQFLEAAPVGETPGQLPRIRLAEVMSVRLPLPDLATQSAVASAVLRQSASVLTLRERALAALTRLSELRETAIRRAMAAPGETVRLTEIVSIQLGKMLSPASRTGVRSLPYVRNANVQWNRLDLSHLAVMDFSEDEERKFQLMAGDVLVCEGGEPGRAAVWDGEVERCCYQKALHRLRAKDDRVDPQYLVFRFWLASLNGEFADEHAQTTIAHLPAVRLAELPLVLPPVHEQRRIVAELRERLEAIDRMTQAISAQLAAVDALPAALLRRAFAEIEAA